MGDFGGHETREGVRLRTRDLRLGLGGTYRRSWGYSDPRDRVFVPVFPSLVGLNENVSGKDKASSVWDTSLHLTPE